MKTIHLQAIACVSLLFAIVACSPSLPPPTIEQETQEIQFPQATGIAHNLSIGHIDIPDGSTYTLLDEGRRVKFTFAEGIKLIWKDASGNAFLSEGIEYVCTCSEPDGNCPIIYLPGGTSGGKDEFGCLQGSCQGTCTGGFHEPPGFERSSAPVSPTNTFINLEQGITLVKDEEELDSLSPYDPAISPLITESSDAYFATFSTDHIAATIQSALKQSRGEIVEETYRTVALNYYGTLVAIRLPVSYLRDHDLMSQVVDVSCQCIAPEGSCVLQESGNVYICLGTCQSCLLRVDDDGEPTIDP